MSISVVQSVLIDGALVTSVTTAAITTTSGNHLIADDAYFNVNYSSNSDSKSNSWASVAVSEAADALGGKIQQRYVENITGGTLHTFTLTMTTNTGYPTLIVKESSGLATSSSLDQHPAANVQALGAGTSRTSSTTGTTAQASELLAGALTSGANLGTLAVGGSFIEDKQVVGGAFENLISAHLVVSSTGTYAFTATIGNDRDTVALIATYKAATAATASLFRSSNLDGLQSGGSFFNDPLGA